MDRVVRAVTLALFVVGGGALVRTYGYGPVFAVGLPLAALIVGLLLWFRLRNGRHMTEEDLQRMIWRR
jgi:hypothetical protein